MDHAKVFDYAHVANRDASAELPINHSPVEVHVVRDVNLEELHRDEERGRQEQAQQLEVAQKGKTAFNQTRVAEVYVEVHW